MQPPFIFLFEENPPFISLPRNDMALPTNSVVYIAGRRALLGCRDLEQWSFVPWGQFSRTPEFDTMQKEDFLSHQTCGTCMKY
jgi:hypothetical protein